MYNNFEFKFLIQFLFECCYMLVILYAIVLNFKFKNLKETKVNILMQCLNFEHFITIILFPNLSNHYINRMATMQKWP